MRRAVLALVLSVALAAASVSEAETPMAEPALHQPEALEPFFSALERLEAGAANRPVHVLQLGDSHTVGDLITASLRSRLQGRFGRGGRGAVPPGRPYPLYQPRQIEVSERGAALVVPAPGSADGASVGLSGGRSLMWGREAAVGIEAEGMAAFGRVVVCAASGPGAGALTLEVLGAEHRLDYRDAAPGALCREVRLNAPARRLSLRGGDGAVTVHSLATFAPGGGQGPGDQGPGIAVSNLGVIGATLNDLAARDAAVVRAELAAWAPDLIVLAFGTNEGFDPFLDPARYETLLRGQVARLRALAPGAALMILGAPDALRAEGGGACEGDAEARWRQPRELALVRDVQRRVAADVGVAFWDWQGRMGGACSAQRLATAVEPLMRADRVHFNSAGGDWIGQMLFEDLTTAYDARRAQAEGAQPGAAAGD